MNTRAVRASATILAAALIILMLGGLALARSLNSICNVPGNHGTIQAAVDDLNCATIEVAAGHYIENVTINRALTINGQQGPARTIVDGGGAGPVVTIGDGITVTQTHALTVTLSHLEIMSGTIGVSNLPSSWVESIVYVEHCQISGNSDVGISNATTDFGYAFASLHVLDSLITSNGGGGIRSSFQRVSSADLTVIASTISDNEATDGGGILAASDTTILNSTISGNTATTGGGIYACRGVHLTNVTISDNNATTGGGMHIFGYDSFPYGCHGAVWAVNSLVANSKSGGDCTLELDGRFHDQGYNLVEDGTCITQPTSLPGDPELGRLQPNGGPTPTQALLPGSPAIDAGDNDRCRVTDQRGAGRPVDGDGDQNPVCDMGSFEYFVYAGRNFLPVIASP